MKKGVACGTNDTDMIEFLQRLYMNGMFDYIELYFLKETTIEQLKKWMNSHVPILYLQAAHDGKARIDKESINNTIAALDFIHAKGVIFDPGTDVRSLNSLKMDGLLIPENMPMKTSVGEEGMLSLPNEMPEHFCLDFSHAWITAKMLKMKPQKMIMDFIHRRPVHFHITDTKDLQDHLPLGEGELDIAFVLSKIPTNSSVTVETDHLPSNREERIISDLLVLKEYENRSHNTGKSFINATA